MTERLRTINVRKEDRWLSMLAGTAILVVTLRPRGAWGVLLALVGGELIYRGLTGRSYAYTVLEFNTQPDDEPEEVFYKDLVQISSEDSFPASDPPSFTGSSM